MFCPRSHESSVAGFRLLSGILSLQLPACLKQPVLCSLVSDKLEECWKLLPGLGAGSISTAAAVSSPGRLEQAEGQNGICHSGMGLWLASPKAGAQPPFSQWDNWGLVPCSPRRAAGHLLPLWEPWCRLGWFQILTAPPDEVLHKIIQNNPSGEGGGAA